MANLTLRSTTSATDPGSTSAKGSALTHTEMDSNFILLQADIDGKISAASPTLTGATTIDDELRFNDSDDSNYITVKAPATVGTNYTLTLPDSGGTSGYVLTTDGSGVLTWTAKTVDTTNLVDDTTPQLGGDLDVNGQNITSASNGNIVLAPNGTGELRIDTDIVEHYTAKGHIITNYAQGSSPDLTSQGADFGTVYGKGIDIQSDGSYAALDMWSHKSNTGYANIWAHRSRDDGAGNKDYLNADDTVFRFFGSGWGGGADTPANFYGAYAPMGSMDLIASENHSSSALGGRWEFKTTSTGTTSETEKLTVDNNVEVNKPRGDVDFIVNGDTNFNVFKVDAGTEEVIIGGSNKITTASNGDLAIEPNGTGELNLKNVRLGQGDGGIRLESDTFGDMLNAVRTSTSHYQYSLQVASDGAGTALTAGNAGGAFGFTAMSDSYTQNNNEFYIGSINGVIGDEGSLNGTTAGENNNGIRLYTYSDNVGYALNTVAEFRYATSEFMNGALTFDYTSNKVTIEAPTSNDDIEIKTNGASGYLILSNLPTSSAGLPTGAVWNDSGTLKIA